MVVQLGGREAKLTASDPLATYVELTEKFGRDRVFLLESLGGPERDNRFSMTGLAGRAEVLIRNGLVQITGEKELVSFLNDVIQESGLVDIRDGNIWLVGDDAFWQLPRVLSNSFAVESGEGELTKSFLTFYGYDAAHYIENLPRVIPDSEDGPPDAVFSLVDVLITHHHNSTDLSVVVSDLWNSDKLEDVLDCVVPSSGKTEIQNIPEVPDPKSIVDDISEEDYLRKGEQCLEHIRVGDIYQVQLGHSITVESEADPFDVYQRLRWRNPSPYMAIMHVAGRTVVCASPEMFVRMDRSTAVMRPIAGTAPRGGDEEKTRHRLLNDPKERAEHLMLVDLCRNDLGKFAQNGSVDTTTLMMIEEYSHVFHIVSEVECRVNPGIDVYDVIRSCFPAGTMSGAPKIRAMEIIESLETSRRGFYAGAFGLVSLNRRDSILGLAIRMAVYSQGAFKLRASAGFVAESSVSGEWEETMNKLASTYWAVTGKEIR